MAQEEFALSFVPTANGIELRWQIQAPSQGTPILFDLETSTDFIHWSAIATNLTSSNGQMRVVVRQAEGRSFYRVKSNQKVSFTGSGGEEIFGYSRAFKRDLALLGQISTDTFSALYPSGTEYLSQVNFNITNANYWTLLDSAPPAPYRDPRGYGTIIPKDFRLNSQEKVILQKKRFCRVSQIRLRLLC